MTSAIPEQQLQLITDYFDNKAPLSTEWGQDNTLTFTKGVTPRAELKYLYFKINDFVLKNKDVLPKDRLAHLTTLIDRKVETLHANTKGLLALFLSLFNWWRNENLRAEAAALKPLGEKISDIIKDLSKVSMPAENEKELTENLKQPPQPLIQSGQPSLRNEPINQTESTDPALTSQTLPSTPIPQKGRATNNNQPAFQQVFISSPNLPNIPNIPKAPPKCVHTPTKMIPIQIYTLENEPEEPLFNLNKYSHLPNAEITQQIATIKTYIENMDNSMRPLETYLKEYKENEDLIQQKKQEIVDYEKTSAALELYMSKMMELNEQISQLPSEHTYEDEPEEGQLIFHINGKKKENNQIIFFSDKAYEYWSSQYPKLSIPKNLCCNVILPIFEQQHEDISYEIAKLESQLSELKSKNDLIRLAHNNSIGFSEFEKVYDIKKACKDKWARLLKSRENFLAGKSKQPLATQAGPQNVDGSDPLPISIIKSLQNDQHTAVLLSKVSDGTQILQLFKEKTTK